MRSLGVALALVAFAVVCAAQTESFLETEIVTEFTKGVGVDAEGNDVNPTNADEQAAPLTEASDELQVLADGKTCAKRQRTRRCKKTERKPVTKCPEGAGFDFKLLPPCVAEQPCIKHKVTCGSLKVGSNRTCLETQKIRTCPEQCEDGQLCMVSKRCKSLGGVTSCEWIRKCKKTTCRPTECNTTDECVRYTEKGTYVHRCNEGTCEQEGETVRSCKSIPVCKVPEVTEQVESCVEWSDWSVKCTAWFPARIAILQKEYAEAQTATADALTAMKATSQYATKAAAKAALITAAEALKKTPEFEAYTKKQQFLSCTYSELACRYFGGWADRRQHCRAWQACNECAYARYACRTATVAQFQDQMCKKKRECQDTGTVKSELHVVMDPEAQSRKF